MRDQERFGVFLVPQVLFTILLQVISACLYSFAILFLSLAWCQRQAAVYLSKRPKIKRATLYEIFVDD